MARLATVGQLSAGIAHEIRNPLTAVRGFLQLLQETQPHRYVDIALGELDRAIATVQNLLHVAKPDMDDEPYRRVSLRAEVEAALYLFQEKTYQITVERVYTGDDVEIFAKVNQLKKVIFNLIQNALEAMGGVGRLRLGHWSAGAHVYLSIGDSGPGIDQESLPLLGTPFYTTKPQGTGMGLTQVFATVYQHGGTVDVQSAPGEGTTFTLRLPINAEVGGLYEMELHYEVGQTFMGFFQRNQKAFYDQLMAECPLSVRLLEASSAEPEDLFRSVNELVLLLWESNQRELLTMGQRFGREGAKSGVAIHVIMELARGIRRMLWTFLRAYYSHVDIDHEGIFVLENKINYWLDNYLTEYFIHYMGYKDEILQAQREAVDELSVPVIPLSATRAILPIVGMIDTHRARVIQERTLTQIAALRLEEIIIDLSAVAFMDTAVVAHLFRIVDGINLMGCRSVVTGIRPEIANTMVTLGISLAGKVETRATLQQALEEAR
ncbi:MAG: ATP-binding protein [Firmicutes bacterium]|nr:ATP-binding protein [Bacillota bacterium]